MTESHVYSEDVVFTIKNNAEQIMGITNQANRLNLLKSNIVKVLTLVTNFNIATCGNSSTVRLIKTHSILYKTDDETISWYDVQTIDEFCLKRYNYCSPWLIHTVTEEIVKNLPIATLSTIAGQLIVFA